METWVLPVLLSNSCHQEVTGARKLQTVDETTLCKGNKSHRESIINIFFLCVTFSQERSWLTAYHWYAEHRLQPTIIVATLPHSHLWVVGTCKEELLLKVPNYHNSLVDPETAVEVLFNHDHLHWINLHSNTCETLYLNHPAHNSRCTCY